MALTSTRGDLTDDGDRHCSTPLIAVRRVMAGRECLLLITAVFQNTAGHQLEPSVIEERFVETHRRRRLRELSEPNDEQGKRIWNGRKELMNVLEISVTPNYRLCREP